ncbi:MAG: hypothetical protein GXP24_05700 [Planctomycetes bacterium]|nr:hypothetical protein [Planctomycetota bacterium]
MFFAWHRRDEMTEAGFRRSMITQRDSFLKWSENCLIRPRQAILLRGSR